MIFTFLFLIKPLYIDFLLLVCVEIHDFYLSVSYKTKVDFLLLVCVEIHGFYLSVSYKTTEYRLSIASVCRDFMVFTFLFLIKPLYIDFLLLVCVEIHGFYRSVS